MADLLVPFAFLRPLLAFGRFALAFAHLRVVVSGLILHRTWTTVVPGPRLLQVLVNTIDLVPMARAIPESDFDAIRRTDHIAILLRMAHAQVDIFVVGQQQQREKVSCGVGLVAAAHHIAEGNRFVCGGGLPGGGVGEFAHDVGAKLVDVEIIAFLTGRQHWPEHGMPLTDALDEFAHLLLGPFDFPRAFDFASVSLVHLLIGFCGTDDETIND